MKKKIIITIIALILLSGCSIKEKDEKKKYLRRERVYGKYSRSFYLGDVDEENIEASYNNGTLHIAVPKIDENKNRKLIDIK